MYKVCLGDEGWRVEVNDYRLTRHGRICPVAGAEGTMAWQTDPNYAG